MFDYGMLSTAGIKDPQVRAFLDRMVQVLRDQSDKAVDEQAARRIAAKTVSDIFGSGGNGGAGDGSATPNGDAIDALAESIQQSLVYQVLQQAIPPIDLSRLQERSDQIGANVVSETTTRVNKDSALASAINNIWAQIGGSSAVIQDGALAAATPSSAVATKWNQVVASVTDPNTGNVSSASILEETRAYADSADDTFNAIYSVRAQVDANGDTVVGGFGLAATTGAGSAEGPRIDFGVLAHRFFIAAPASGYNPATQYDANLQFPFIVVTTPTTINGVTYPAGVYLKKAIIGEASIDTAKIAQHINSNNFNGTFDASGNILTNGTNGWAIDKSGKAVFSNVVVRGDVQATSINGQIVGSGNIEDNSCTIPLSAVTSASLSLTGSAQTALTLPSFQSKGGSVFLHAAFNVSVISVGSEDPLLTAPLSVRWKRNSTEVFLETFTGRSGIFIVPPVVDNPTDGTNIVYTLEVFTGGGGDSIEISKRRGYALEAVR